MNNRKVLLMILDGWGIGDGSKSDVISQAKTPNMHRIKAESVSSYLLASGENVGLPDGQMGNSEVGHLNIGAGRVVYQDLVKINKDCKTNEIRNNKILKEAFAYARDKGRSVHFMGLLSDGGVHSLDKHLYSLCDMTTDFGLSHVYIHAFGDGRDTDPRSGAGYMKSLSDHISGSTAKVASFIGRYYAMDRDKRWERVKEAYDLLVHGEGSKTKDVVEALKKSYEEGITDEFVKPVVVVDENGDPVGRIKDNDVVIFFNFRNDRARELTIVLSQRDMPEFGMKKLPLHFCTMTPYDATFENLKIIYPKENVTRTLGEILAENGRSQLRIAETEKYAHVTFFFSGGREEPFKNESRVMIASPKVATYDLKPEMSAPAVTEAVIREINGSSPDFICLNFANGDMVGHTGVYSSIIKAIETVDKCVGEVVKAATAKDYEVVIIADHGNADFALNEDGSENTAHSLNPVPFIVISKRYSKAVPGILADVAPTILMMMGVNAPEEMSGRVLVS